MRIVYHSFQGRYSDSPRAVYEALLARGDDVEHVWLASTAHAHGFPESTTTVPFGSPECVAALESADVVVSNTHIDLEWDKRPDTFYLQTWHGTPLKTVHNDVGFALDGVLARLDRDIARWDALLAQNAVSTPNFRHAFGWTGPVHETGYPRNDVLSAPDRDEHRARVRAELGIADGVTAVLYTPTWRDDDVLLSEGPDFTLHLDLERFAERLGDDHVLLLRMHYMVSDALGTVDVPGVVDLSFYPDINELYLAADVMVTDYSSTQFDFAITGRPIVYFAYDLDHYVDMRGLYFDYRQLCPGPLVTTSEGVLDAVSDLDALAARYAQSLTEFRRTFCSLDDGHATERVLDLIPFRGLAEPELSRRSACTTSK
jgi:CDP-glycerol glycerophosphotransferase